MAATALMLIGRIATTAEELEFIVTQGIHAALPGDHVADDDVRVHKYAAGNIITAGMDFYSKIELLRLLSASILDERPATRLVRLLVRADDARSLRNDRLHAIASMQGRELRIVRVESRRRTVHESGPLGEPIPISLDQLKRDADQISSICYDLNAFLWRNELWLLPSPGRYGPRSLGSPHARREANS